MQPVAAAENWGIPEIESPGALAEWFGISTGELRWFSDLKGLVYEKDRSTLRHYHYRVLAKQSGNIRLIEAPKPRLKELQRQVLSRILESVPPHASVHGFLKGHSIKTFAAPHVGRRIILRMDLQDFFLPFPAQEFRASSARWATPNRLPICGGIYTNATPRDAWRDLGVDLDRIHLRETQDLYARPHLPRWCGVHAICRRSRVFHRRDIIRAASRTILNTGCRDSDGRSFSVHHRKTRIMRRGVR